MSSGVSRDQNVVAAGSNASPAVARRVSVSRGVLWFVTISLVLAAWPVAEGWLYKPGSDFGYYIGLIGGLMMLALLLYPLRKHVRWAYNWGPLRHWFKLHMVFGIVGPVLILFHSTFHVKSLNAGVALFSMLLVAFSGIVGRFIYTRIHHGLYGRRSNLEEMQQAVDINQEKVSAVLVAAPEIGEKLKQFRDAAFAQERALPIRAWKFMTMNWRRHNLAVRCRLELWRAVVHVAKTQGWDNKRRKQYWQVVALQVGDYLRAVQEAAQFSAYERLFRLWHILHVPFVWLLVISAIVHVIAVYMY